MLLLNVSNKYTILVSGLDFFNRLMLIIDGTLIINQS